MNIPLPKVSTIEVGKPATFKFFFECFGFRYWFSSLPVSLRKTFSSHQPFDNVTMYCLLCNYVFVPNFCKVSLKENAILSKDFFLVIKNMFYMTENARKFIL